MTDKQLWPVFSQFIRIRDSDQEGYCKCFTCGWVKYWKDGDCGHGIGRQHMATKYDEKNNHFQCKHCNGFEGGKREKYKEQVNKLYGPQTWDLLELKARQPCKWGKFEFGQMKTYYEQQIKELLKTKNFTI